ncbi:hypothetical protein ACSLBF_00195 [Pseudoalteromonas sp. T1lg65]|uniref:hypothetical protein n=1 Tax=Pseudoalteromonas sp. T1lg65 TaxID=2077101 RepID=UPI003F796558
MKISEITHMPAQQKSSGVIDKKRKNLLKQSRKYKQEIADLMASQDQEKEHSEQQYLLGYN